MAITIEVIQASELPRELGRPLQPTHGDQGMINARHLESNEVAPKQMAQIINRSQVHDGVRSLLHGIYALLTV